MSTLIIPATAFDPAADQSHWLGIGDRRFMPLMHANPWAFSMNGDTQRFDVRAGDVQSWDLTHQHDAEPSERSEVERVDRFDFDQPLHVSFGFTLEDGPKITSSWAVFGQLHQDDLTTSPPFSIEIHGDGLMRFYVRPGDGTGQHIVGPVTRGVEHRLDVFALFRSDGTGQIVVALDGQAVSYKGKLGYPDKGRIYWKHGVYRRAADETLAARYRDLRIVQGAMVEMPALPFKPLADAPSFTVTMDSTMARFTCSRSASVYDGAARIGGGTKFSAPLGAGIHVLTCSSRENDGRRSASSASQVVAIGTAADIYPQLNRLACMEGLAAIVLTDTKEFTVSATDAKKLPTIVAANRRALERIAGGYVFVTYSGLGSARHATSYGAAGAVVR